jgi:serine protease Do
MENLMLPIRLIKGIRRMWPNRCWGIAAMVLAGLMLFAPRVDAQRARPSAPSTQADLSESLQDTARLVNPAVVEIFATGYVLAEGVVPSASDLVTTQRASGSGVIVDPEGFIVTNAHVVRGMQRVRVSIPIPSAGHSILAGSSRMVTGQLVGMDLETDLAVIKVNETNLPAVAFGDSEDIRAGQIVVALGSPLGFQNSVSLGVVSAIARQLQPESPMIYIQTDTAIHPGSSGGPLVDLRGRLVGINTLTASEAGPAFAAPSNIVRSVYEQIRKTGLVRRGDIGISAQTVTPVLASGLRLPRDHGVIVADVSPGSPAARVGLRPGDIVISLDGKPMENGRQLQVNLYRRLVGEVVTLEILREGRTLTVPVAMTERAEFYTSLPSDPHDNLVARLGILALNLDAEIALILPVSRVRSGVVVVSTVAGGIGARDGGLAARDVIIAVNGSPVSRLSDLRSTMDSFKTGDPVVLQLQRSGELMYLAFTVE